MNTSTTTGQPVEVTNPPAPPAPTVDLEVTHTTERPQIPTEPVTNPATASQTVPQYTVQFGDEFLTAQKSKIQKDLANFNNPQARKETVAGRIHTALERMLEGVGEAGFTASIPRIQQTKNYLETVVTPTLKAHGHPFEKMDALCDALCDLTTEEVARIG